MKRFLVFVLLLPLFLHASWEELFSENEDPALFHHVHVISGNLHLNLQDTIVEGAKSIPIRRSYTSAGALEISPNRADLLLRYNSATSLMRGGWNFFSHAHLTVEVASKEKNYKAYLAEESGGGVIQYSFSHLQGARTIFLKPDESPSQSAGVLSGRTNSQNNRLKINLKKGKAVLVLPNGGKRIYEGKADSSLGSRQRFFRLKTEILPSAHKLNFSYNKNGRLEHIELTNPSGSKTFSWIHFDLTRTSSPFAIQARTSDGKMISYKALEHKDRDYLCDVESSSRLREHAHYTPSRKGKGARIEALYLGEQMQFKASYVMPPDEKTARKWAARAEKREDEKKHFATDRVNLLEAPIGPNGQLHRLGLFAYHLPYTDVRDTDGILTRYHHDGHRLTHIEYFNEHDKLHSSLKFIWQGERLRAKVKLDGQGRPLFSKTFAYDEFGNVHEETLYGNLTGLASSSFSLNGDGSLSGAESYRKRFAYLPGFNLVTYEEEEGGLIYRYSYKPSTDLLASKLTYDHEKIVARELFFYNEDNLLTCEIRDDANSSDPQSLAGATERQIKRYELDPSTGLAKVVTDTYFDFTSGNEKLLKKTHYTYTNQLKINSETIFDADGKERYTLRAEYDAYGNVIRKTDPLGHENIYKYSVTGTLLEAKELGAPRKLYAYDAARRPISCEEIDSSGRRKISYSTYDAKGRLLAQTDTKENTTTQLYDFFGRCLKTLFPRAEDENGESYEPVVHFTYDVEGNLTSTITPKGETTQTFYNTLRKPVRIIQADGTETFHLYNKNGTLAKTRYADGSEIHYAYDSFQRVLSKTVLSANKTLLSEERWTHSTFRTLSSTDARGLTTIYTYDGAGRKICEEAAGRKRIFSYDSLGFLERTESGGHTHVQIHDVAGRVVEEWQEEKDGAVENPMSFFYNAEGRKERALRLTPQGEAVDHFAYDAEGRLSSHTDPFGRANEFIYNDSFINELGQRVLQKRSSDPLGNATIDTYDALNRIISVEKKCPGGRTVSKEAFFYDRSGNKSRRVSTVYVADTPERTLTASWEYDSLGRPIKEIEAGQKITCYTYDTRGRVSTRTLPSGISLAYSYDELGRLTELESSDRTVHYRYFYEKGAEPVEILDLVQNSKFQASYNLFGEQLHEVNNHLILNWKYDEEGRCTCVELPDQSWVTYEYEGSHLAALGRVSPNDKKLYEHRYTKFDVNGRVAGEELIGQLGSLTTERDLLERPSSQTSKWLNQRIFYGPSSLVMRTESSLTGTKNYAYDPLGQLIQEEGQDKGKEYLFDSIGNPTRCKIDECNQILESEGNRFIYDPDGNPTKRINPSETTNYHYDALGRLIEIIQPEKRRIRFTYDPLSRLFSKETFTYLKAIWQPENRLFYLYDRDKEIGTLDAQGTILDLKLLGLGMKGEIGAAVAIETQGALFAPLHDFYGNIIALINGKGEVAEVYKLDAFGREESEAAPLSQPLSPWRFSSKRSEEGLIFFGKRFYDPALGRWLTPDPSGFADGPNLYVFVLNSPLNRLDLFGLSSEFNFAQNLQIYVPNNLLLGDTSGLFHCKAFVNGVSVDCVVSCGHFHKLEFSPEELRTGQVNIVDHFHELVPKEGSEIGLISAQNGILNTLEDFSNMGLSVISKVPEKTLFIGFYNPTDGIFGDLARVKLERKSIDTPIVCNTRQFFGAIIETLHKINPDLLWAHVAHSEGGLIALRAIEGMPPEHKNMLRQHLLISAFGPALAIPRTYALDVTNVYSSQDYLTRASSIGLQNNPNYDIQVIPCVSTWSQRTGYLVDHYMMGDTYQRALNDQIDDWSKKFGFYNDKTH